MSIETIHKEKWPKRRGTLAVAERKQVAIIPPGKEVLAALRKAHSAAKKCSDACANADALVQTYWPRDGVAIAPNFLETRKAREVASITYGMTCELLSRAEATLRRNRIGA